MFQGPLRVYCIIYLYYFTYNNLYYLRDYNNNNTDKNTKILK